MRVLIAGLGAIGQRHARNLHKLYGADLELLAYRRRRLPFVITESLERDDSRNVEDDLGVSVFEDLDEALAAKPNAVFVCTPSSHHVAIAQRAADAGCHLFIEKPVSNTLDGLDRLRETVSANRLVVLVGCQWRYHPCVRWLKELLADDRLGRLTRAEIEYAEYLPDWHPYEDYRSSYAVKSELGGGVVLTQIHDYDLAWWLFGPARTVTASGGHLSSLEADVEDTVHAELTGGATTVRVRQTFASGPPRRIVVVSGEHGSVSVDLLAARITPDSNAISAVACANYQRNQMFVDEIRHFMACIAGHERPKVPLDHGIAVLRLALAVKDAMRTGQTIEVA